MLIQQQPCVLQIDYSTIVGERIIPFVITLDVANSILNPVGMQNQRFCYTITGVGSDTPIFADLSHLVLGICPEITENQITNITVIIDGIDQTVEFGEGGNVELLTPEQPDPTTGCPGLKFDFGLDKVDGEMTICFDLTTPYPIGPNPVCLSGGGVTAEGLSICGPSCTQDSPCVAVAYQPASVCAPVNVRPFVNVGEPITYCCGNPIIRPVLRCDGIVNGSCTFTITQNICVEVPVEFGAIARVGAPRVNCGEATEDDICSECGAAIPANNAASYQQATGSHTVRCSTCKR